MKGDIHIHWFVNRRVRLLNAVGVLDLQTVKEYDDESRRIYDASKQPIHVILDVRDLISVPPLSECLKMATLWHKRLDLFVTVGGLSRPMPRLIMTTIVRIGRLKYRDFETVDMAMRYVAAQDPSLPPLETWTPSPFDRT